MATDPIGGVIANLFTLQRLGNGLAADAAVLLGALFDDLAAELARLDPSEPKTEAARRERLEHFFGRAEELSAEQFAALREEMQQSLAAIGVAQGAWAGEQLRRTIGSVAVEIGTARTGQRLMHSILTTEPIHGRLLGEWWGGLSAATQDRVRQQVRLGMMRNEPIGDLVRRLRGRFVGYQGIGKDRRPKYEGGVLQTTTRDAEAIARTAVNHIANTAHLETYRENADVVSAVEFVATLDSRTTILCASLDGTRWPLESSEIRKPALHVRCRSILVSVIDWEALGLEPPPEGQRASANGPVASSLKYEQWLKDQPKAVQDEILGPARAQLFREGKITLKQMVDGDGRVLRVGGPAAASGATPERPSFSRSEMSAARHAVFDGTEDERGNRTPTSIPRTVARGRRPVWAALAGQEGLDALADDLQWDPKLVMRGQDPREVKAQFVGGKLAQKWEHMTPKDRPAYYAMQLATRDEFNLQDAAFGHFQQKMLNGAAAEFYAKHGPALRAYMRAQHEATVAYLKERGVEHLTLVRGIKNQGAHATVEGALGTTVEQPFVSFSARPKVAWDFAFGEEGGLGGGSKSRRPDGSYVAVVRVPVDRVLSMPRRGMGKWEEEEYIVMGGELESFAIDVKRAGYDARTEEQLNDWLFHIIEAAGLLR